MPQKIYSTEMKKMFCIYYEKKNKKLSSGCVFNNDNAFFIWRLVWEQFSCNRRGCFLSLLSKQLKSEDTDEFIDCWQLKKIIK